MTGEIITYQTGGAVRLETEEKDGELVPKLVNSSNRDVSIKEALVMAWSREKLGFSDAAMVYCEGYQKLNSTYVLFRDISEDLCSMDKDHYKLPQTKGFFTGYNYVCFSENGRVLLIGAASCHSYTTEIRLNRQTLQLVQCLEGRAVPPGGALPLESYVVLEGTDKNRVLEAFAAHLMKNHPTIPFREVPDGWCRRI